MFSCVQDDEDLDLFGDETEEEKAAADEREAAKKAAAGAKKKESKCLLGLFLALSVVQCASNMEFSSSSDCQCTGYVIDAVGIVQVASLMCFLM